MRLRVALIAPVALGAVLGLAGPPGARADSSDEARMTAVLSAKEIVPGPGPDGGSGRAELESDADENKLCYELTYQGISRPTSGSVRRGPAGANGPVEVDFDVAKRGDKACVAADEAILEAIAANPGGHYVVLTTREYPEGAVRGQLARAG